MDKKTLMEFGLRALREQTPPIPKVRPSAPPRSAPPTSKPDYNQYSNMKSDMARRLMHGDPIIDYYKGMQTK